ncbi:MAG TPA: GspE/PulE family protein [Solirubrobacterales bacterium]|nr:GspE/PulE family protein [Solirubrobacterales bacterium]
MKATPRRRLGDVIVELGFADRGIVEATVALAREDGRPIGQALVESNIIDSTQLARALAARNGLEYVDLNSFEVDHGAANLIGSAEARRYRAIPIGFVDEDALLVATADPANLFGLDSIGIATERKVRPVVTTPEDLEALISQLSRLIDSVDEVGMATEDDEDPEPEIELRESADEAPVVKLVHTLIADAVNRGTSDIHLDPSGADLRVRFRVDGVVVDSATVPKRLATGLISRVKIMANLDIAERRVPQDGRIGLTVDGRFIDIRVATLPVMRGESAVLRILDKDRLIMELDELGMKADDREVLERSVVRSSGAVLVTGPTGSGKTTTLYATLAEINTPEKTLIAIEDPVEYELDGVKQIQVNPKVGLTFASGLRSMIRSDPDVLMVGEIRDRETAQIAVESALTGHLVLSTLHTGDAPMAPARLIEMGIEPFLIASAIECVVAQRLVRRLCDDCKRPVEVSADELRRSGLDGESEPLTAYEPVGCVRCNGSGFRGRVGVYEVLDITDSIRSLILSRASSAEIGAAAVAEGMRRMPADGLEKVRAGATSISEVLRVLDA